AKGSFDVLPSGETRPSEQQRPIVLDDEETPFGALDGEVVPVKGWCDVALLGHAWSPPPGEPVPRSLVTLRIGDGFVLQARVSGDRVWVRAAGKLVASDPVPFRKLPLDYAHAFGGPACLENPGGRGRALDQNDAAGKALPNIEEADQPVAAWDDAPAPAGFM